jgi:hypothetical protein
MPNGIRDFGANQGYTAIDLVIAAHECDLEKAFAFLNEHLSWSGGEVLLDISNPAGSTPKLEMLGLAELDDDDANGSSNENSNGSSNGNGADHPSASSSHNGSYAGASNGASSDTQASAQIIPFKPAVRESSFPDWKTYSEPDDNSESSSESATDTGTPTSDPLLEPLTYVPGLVGDVTNHIVNSARRPNRVFALGAAISVVGTLAGRRARGPTKSAMQLYIINLGPSGSGKEHPLVCIQPLLEAAGAGSHVHLADFSSQSVFNKRLVEMPLTIAVIDEFAGFLSRIVSRYSSSWERQLVKQLNMLWSKSFQPYGTTATAQERSVTIESPAFSLLGAATPEEFWEVLQGAEVTNGLFSRFLVFESDTEVPERDPLISDEIPAGLKARLAELYEFGNTPFKMAQINNSKIRPEPQDLPWVNGEAGEARKIYYRLSKWVDREIANDASKRPYIRRVAETAVRLAQIRAVGIAGHRAKVDADDMTWGADLASILVTRMMNQSQDSIPETPRGQVADKLVNVIARKGPMTVRAIQQYIRSRHRSPEINDILTQSVVAGRIVKLPDGSYAAPPKPSKK